MKIEQVPTFKRNVKKLNQKHYDLVGIIKGTHPTVWYVHVDRSYNDNWALCYRIENDRLVLLLLKTGGHEVLKHLPYN